MTEHIACDARGPEARPPELPGDYEASGDGLMQLFAPRLDLVLHQGGVPIHEMHEFPVGHREEEPGDRQNEERAFERPGAPQERSWRSPRTWAVPC